MAAMKRGRPRKSTGERSSDSATRCVIGVRVLHETRRLLEVEADALGVTLSTLCAAHLDERAGAERDPASIETAIEMLQADIARLKARRTR